MGAIEDFTNKYLPFAVKTQLDTGFSGAAILVQASIESANGKSVPGNMFFGIKADSSWKGDRQLLKTLEYFPASKRSYYKNYYSTGGRQVISVKENAKKNSKGVWMDLFTVRTWFRAYKTPTESFNDHTDFFLRNSNYKNAVLVKANPSVFLSEIAAAGYATSPTYKTALLDRLKIIKPIYDSKFNEVASKIGSNPGASIASLFFLMLAATAAISQTKIKKTVK